MRFCLRHAISVCPFIQCPGRGGKDAVRITQFLFASLVILSGGCEELPQRPVVITFYGGDVYVDMAMPEDGDDDDSVAGDDDDDSALSGDDDSAVGDDDDSALSGDDDSAVGDDDDDDSADLVEDPCLVTERRLLDLDGDVYGDPNRFVYVSVCEPWNPLFVSWIEGRADCDDLDSSVHPDAVEVCGDGIDQDCDLVDEACTPPAPTVSITTVYHVGTVVQGEQDVVFADVTIEVSTEVTVRDLLFSAIGDDDGSFATIENDLDFGDRVSDCSLRNVASGIRFAGPTWVVSGALSLTDDFYMNAPLEFELACDLDIFPLGSGDADLLTFEIDPSGTWIEDVNGNSVTNITYSSSVEGGVLEPGITVLESGSLDMGLSDNTPVNNWLVADSTNNHLLSLRFDAEYEDVVVEELDVLDVYAGDAPVTAVTLAYVDEDGNFLTQASAVDAYGVARFSGLEVFVPAGDSTIVNVFADLGSLAPLYDTSRSLSFAVDPASVVAYAQSSGMTVIPASTSLVRGADFQVYESIATVNLHPSSPSGASVPGYDELLRFNVTSDSRGDISMYKVMLNVAATDNALSGWNTCGGVLGDPGSWDIFNFADMSTALPVMDAPTLMAGTEPCDVAPDDAVVTQVQIWLDDAWVVAGTTETFSVFGDATSASSAADDSIILETRLVWKDEIAYQNGGTVLPIAPRDSVVTGGTVMY